MADNIPITAGSGTNVATDDVSTVHFQRVKLVDGTLDSSSAIGGDSTFGLDVDLTRLPADSSGSGSLTAGGQAVTYTVGPGEGSFGVQVTGTWVGTITWEVTIDDTNWIAVEAYNVSNKGYQNSTSNDSNSIFTIFGSGFLKVRARMSAFTSGTATVTWRGVRASGSVMLGHPIPPGSAVIGKVVGAEAHDAPTAQNPISVGGTSSQAAPTAVSADAEIVRLWLDRRGATMANLVAAGALIGGDATNGLDADVTRLPTGTVAGSATVAHDAADAGDPIKVGHRALAHGANPTAVAAADRTDWYSNRHGIPWVIGGHPNVQTIRLNWTAAQTDTAVITVGAGSKIVVTRVTFTMDNANTVDVAVRLGFGTANTPTTTGVVATHPGIPKGGGFNVGDGSGILGVGADNEDLRLTAEVPTTGSGDVTVSYYTIES